MRNKVNVHNDYSRKMFIGSQNMDVVRDVAASLDSGYAMRGQEVMRCARAARGRSEVGPV